MIPENKNFEEFMDFRDMIQGDALDDRMKMVQYMSKKPVMAMARGGSIENQEENKRIAKVGDSLAEVYVEAALAKNPDMFKKFYKQQARMSEGADLVAGGLASMPMVNASFGGFLKDLAIDVGKSVVGDIAGEFVGGIAESFSPAIADALGTTAGKAIFGAGTNALIDYGLNEVFDYGAKPDIYSFGTDVALRGFADYMATPEEERSVFGELFLDEDEDAEKIAAIRAARDKIRASRLGELEFDTQGPKGGSRRKEPASFMDRVANYARLDQAVKDPTTRAGGRQLALRGLEPFARSILKSEFSEEQPQNQIPQVARPKPQVAKLSNQVGGLRGITVPAKVDRSELNQRQITELGTKGFTIHKGKRITKQDLVGRTEYARRTKPIAAATGGLVSLRDDGGPVISKAQEAYMNWLRSQGGPSALSKRALRQGRIDEVMTPSGPEYFSYSTGESSQDVFGEGMYDDQPGDMEMFPFAYPENREKFLFARRSSPANVVRSIQTIAPSDSNREFVLRLLGLQEDNDVNLDLIEANQGGSIPERFTRADGRPFRPRFGEPGYNERGVVTHAQQAYMDWLKAHGGPGALSKAGLRKGRIDEIDYGGDVGKVYFQYDPGESYYGEVYGAGMYDDDGDIDMFPFAYPEHPDFKLLNALGGGPRALPPRSTRVAKSIETIAPSDSNIEFVLKLLGFEEDDDINLDLIEANQGGSLMTDQFSGMVGGDGHGMEDNVQMPIVSDGEQVATLAVSPKEYVVDAYTMAALGNGNADEGAKIMDETIKSIRRKAYGTNKQPNEIDGSKALRSGLRSIA